MPDSKISFDLKLNKDVRGNFIELFKNQNSGQISFFSIKPKKIRGNHYHNTKTEKFLVIKGEARFGFRHMITGEFYELYTSGDVSQIVETVPGWTHDITNVGDEELICMLWANEIFDLEKPDTFARAISANE